MSTRPTPSPTPQSIHLGRRMRNARKTSGLSQQMVAQAIGTTRQTIIAIERGENVGIHLVLAMALNVGIEELVIYPGSNKT